MDVFDDKQRIIQEFVPGKQVTLAHVIASPDLTLYSKLGLIEEAGAIGIFTNAQRRSNDSGGYINKGREC